MQITENMSTAGIRQAYFHAVRLLNIHEELIHQMPRMTKLANIAFQERHPGLKNTFKRAFYNRENRKQADRLAKAIIDPNLKDLIDYGIRTKGRIAAIAHSYNEGAPLEECTSKQELVDLASNLKRRSFYALEAIAVLSGEQTDFNKPAP